MRFKDFVKIISEEDYREILAFNYSTLKAMCESGPKVLIEKEEYSSNALEFGTLVDILLTNPENRYDRFYTESIVKPTASLLVLADAIYLDHLIKSIPYEEVVDVKNVVNKAKELGLWSKSKDETIVEKFNNDLFYKYIQAKIKAEGKIICTPELVEAAENCAKVLKTHEYSRELFIENEDIEVLKQVPILYRYKGFLGKGKIDLLRIDHKNKIIYPYDIKTGSDLPTNFPNSFMHFKYYLQAAAYMYGLSYMINETPELKEYKLDTFKFLYISKKVPETPVIYNVPEPNLISYFEGWTSASGEYVKGLKDLIEEFIFYKTNDIYTIEKKVIENHGILNLSLS